MCAFDPWLQKVTRALTQNEPSQPGDIAVAVEEQAVGHFSITPSTARLLVVAFNRLWEGGVDDEAHVRLINSHAKSNSRTYNLEQNKSRVQSRR